MARVARPEPGAAGAGQRGRGLAAGACRGVQGGRRRAAGWVELGCVAAPRALRIDYPGAAATADRGALGESGAGMDGEAVVLVPVDAARTRPLRQRVLRPHQRAEELVYPGDDAPATLHLVACAAGGTVLGVASIYCEPPPGTQDQSAWRLRGMAVAEEVRGRGIGSRLLQRCLAHARRQGGSWVWCHARLGALGFYRRHGFVAEGEPFELAGVGPHRFMRRELGGSPGGAAGSERCGGAGGG
ncbi:MAG: hypothetical protein KatS3mg102_2803 [Planctomycetota bacterium]|nr:MAG: hypothetical protein KatS3mg102_2803 [Planctomycetota bacterium]